ncbi:hypothetical protein PMAYCL1PPCAC_03385 [Pristionchus mayeri]|uniref:Uncharacterized protein n=1 Tax=Pristionchus mayeri TaxID=1317129 RepID=A0AAN4Z8M1_9BILA|nr:hypothetical protein PMAYCL1PPCAC_03385 [Pristionchus mayeri]
MHNKLMNQKDHANPIRLQMGTREYGKTTRTKETTMQTEPRMKRRVAETCPRTMSTTVFMGMPTSIPTAITSGWRRAMPKAIRKLNSSPSAAEPTRAAHGTVATFRYSAPKKIC